MKKFLIIIIFFLILTNTGAIFYAIEQVRCGQTSQFNNAYKWLNPQLRFTEEPVVSKTSYEIFRNDLIKILEQLEKEGRISEVAVFFRDLNNGPTFGINTNDKFIPASLLKVPLMLTYFRLAEENPALLNQELSDYKFPSDLTQGVAPSETLEEGKPYKVEDLLYRLIVYSDNRALQILSDYLSQISPDKSLYAETFNELGIIDAWSKDIEKETISVKSYAAIFWMLYNASYLSKEFSNKALDYLLKSEFNDGLRKGVPDAVPIAHKFGERFMEGNRQLHDCGIVYYPLNPYLLCVMTRGSDLNALSEAIGIVSKAVYEEFDSRRLK